MPEGDILHDTAGDCSDKELLTARLPAQLQHCSTNSAGQTYRMLQKVQEQKIIQ